jgi:hypothetical protein
LLILAGVLIVGSVLAVADLRKADSALVARVSGQTDVHIDLTQALSISPYLLGSNVFVKTGTSSKDQKNNGIMSYSPEVIQGLRSANVKLLRFPGGDWGEQHTLSNEQLDAYSELLNQVGAEGFMQVQLSDPLNKTPVSLDKRAARAALLVEYMNNQQSIQRTNTSAPFHAVTYWAIGNEPDLLNNPDTRKKYTVDEYAQAFIAYSTAMHEKDSKIKVFGPEISQYLGKQGPKDAAGKLWLEDFLKAIATYERGHNLPYHLLDGVSFHRYPLGDSEKDPGKFTSNPAEWDNVLPTLRQFIKQQFDRDVPIAISEINTNPGKTAAPPDLAATWWAETLAKLMSQQVEYVGFFSTEGVDAPLPLFADKGKRETAMLRAMQIFTHLQNKFVPGQHEQGPVSVYATQSADHNTVSLLLINKTNGNQLVDIKADSLLPVGTWRPAKVTIASYSMAVLTLHRNGSNEAFSFNTSSDAQQPAPAVQQSSCGSAGFTC